MEKITNIDIKNDIARIIYEIVKYNNNEDKNLLSLKQFLLGNIQNKNDLDIKSRIDSVSKSLEDNFIDRNKSIVGFQHNLDNKLSNLTDRYRELQSNLLTIQNSIIDKTREYSSIEKDILEKISSIINKEVESIKNMYKDSMESDLDRKKYKEQLDELKSKLDKTLEEKNILQQNYDKLKLELDEKTKKINDYENKLKIVNEQLNSLRKASSDDLLKEKNNQLINEINTLKQEYNNVLKEKQDIINKKITL
jgi:chromosome segregation ATPase